MDIHDKKILITGAPGSLAKQLIYVLNKRGIKPIAHVRETSNTEYIDSLGLEKRVADLREDSSLPKLVEGVDLVIHTAAWVNFRQDRLTQFTGINTMAALNLFRAAQKAGVKRFLHVSTVAAIGASPKKREDDDDYLVREDAAFNLEHLRIPYILTKHAAEEELKKAAAEGATELVIVNPSIIVAPSRTGDDRAKASRMFSRLVIPDPSTTINLVDIRDVAPGVITALEKGRHGHRYILAGDNITVRDLVLDASSILGKYPHVMTISPKFLNFAARAAVTWAKLTGKGKISFYPDLVRMLDFDWVYSSTKARNELNYGWRSIHETLDDLLNNQFIGTYMRPGNGEHHK